MDARVARTRARLQEALLELARERPASEVSISDIADRAGVNRSTFYQHYADRDTLLADALDAEIAKAGAQLNHSELDPDVPPAVLVDFLSHISLNVDIYRQALTGAASGAVIVRMRARVSEMIRESAPAVGFEVDRLPVDVMSAGVAGSVLGVITAWLEREPLEPPAVAAEWAWAALFGPGRTLEQRHVAETPES
ncbi:TetR/AcrR family transcriptional regulator [Demequina zhanjiangensis]|uniref:TetR/AcrR family transcriptional regulator n=1 Tax=Demequina zhanjiangensis TaxID=3051659 RepID=A0ABT8G2J6_9MICO|nr:TetR/AcrR family transcriptional regulator [Demequina sp. SYSU T00b26]MDN4472909.1 TetR/AcrR family transcriptional regulator [Demequina sp. SYSU T00b26]